MAVIPMGSNIGINSISPLKDGISKISQLSPEGVEDGFKAVFRDLIDNVEKTEEITKEDAYKLSIGEADDLHTMMINAARADIALQTMVQLRNKVLEAYSEVMRINL
ncbi:MAG TPA: flagellar hook-basal body complex protein FliE [Bacillota bacterium]|nr:flagellar hook-basal body complex protein FliE [Bacillota bacterium]